jgi:hypothetical protein
VVESSWRATTATSCCVAADGCLDSLHAVSAMPAKSAACIGKQQHHAQLAEAQPCSDTPKPCMQGSRLARFIVSYKAAAVNCTVFSVETSACREAPSVCGPPYGSRHRWQHAITTPCADQHALAQQSRARKQRCLTHHAAWAQQQPLWWLLAATVTHNRRGQICLLRGTAPSSSNHCSP